MTSLFSKNVEIDRLLFARPLTAPVWGIIIVGVLTLIVLLYRREREIHRGWRIGLGATRIMILLLIVAALFEPTAIVRETYQEKRTLAVLIDTSKSMTIKDQRKRPEAITDAAVALGYIPLAMEEAPDGGSPLNTVQRKTIAASSRLALTRTLLSKSAAPLFDSIGEDLNVRYYTFGDTVEVLGDSQGNPRAEIESIKADKAGSALATAIRSVANANRGRSLAGIVVLSDGIETGSDQPEAVAYDLGARGIPVYTIPMGVPDPDDVSIRNAIVQDVAFVGDTVPVRVQIRSNGYEKRASNLVVRFDEKEVAKKNVVLEGGLQVVDLAFDARVKAKGAVLLEVEIESFAGEATVVNNTITRSVRVVNEKINVLCIEGSARWEYRYLRAILKRDPRINATFIATRAGNDLAMHASDYIARFPEDADAAFKYDLVILGDVDKNFFNPGELARLQELVSERGGSLLMLAGPKHSPSSYAESPVEDMLPVKINAKEKWFDVDKNVYPVLTPEGRSSLVLTLERDRDKNDRIWTHVAPMDRLPPLGAPRPGASVLAALSDAGTRTRSYPLISWQRYGTGKCMLMATDRLWRLRLRTGDKYHWRVWSQCIQFLTLSRLMGEHKRIRMETDRVSYPEGREVRIYAEVLDEDFEPVLRSNYDVYVSLIKEDDDDAENVDDEPANRGTRVNLRPDTTRPGLYAGYFTPPGKGRYRIRARKGDADISNMIEIQVADVRAEMVKTDMQLERLQHISRLSGGECLRVADIADMGKSVDRTPKTMTSRTELSLWRNWIFALLIVALTGFEWMVRRRHDLL